MMRTAPVLSVLASAACGRVAFEPMSADAGGTSGDVLADGAALTCPASYTQMGASCYRFAINPIPELSWLDAELACEADGSDAHLMVIDDDAEQTLALTALGPSSDAWIGVTDRLTEGAYLTVTGDVFAVPAWSAAEPDGDAQDCLRIMNTMAYGDRLCSDVNDYICEIDGRPVVAAF